MSITGNIVDGVLQDVVVTQSVQVWYVDAEGHLMGLWVDSTIDPPEDWIEVPFGPPIHADQIWDFDTQTWGPSLYATTVQENAWREAEMAVIAEQLLMIEDDDPNMLPGTAAQWRAYRIQVRAWKEGNVNFPFGTRPTRPV